MKFNKYEEKLAGENWNLMNDRDEAKLLLKEIRERLDKDDAGPVNEGWQSNGLVNLLQRIDLYLTK